MSHRIDFDNLSQKLFLLHNLCLSSKSYCLLNKIHRDDDVGYENWIFYLHELKSYLSETLLEFAIKVRVIQDIIKSEEYPITELDVIDKECCEGLVICSDKKKQNNLNVRQTCNKIIHATDFHLSWVDISNDNEAYTYWDSKVEIFGTHHSKEWAFTLNTIDFCQSTKRFIEEVQDRIDWYRIYKYDW